MVIGVDSGDASIVTVCPISCSVSLPRPARKLSHSLAYDHVPASVTTSAQAIT